MLEFLKKKYAVKGIIMRKQTKTKETNINNIYIAIIMLVVVALIIGIMLFRFYMLGFRNTSDEQEFDQYYVLLTDDPQSSLWQSIYQGAYLEGQEKNIYVDLLGENLGTQYSCNELMDIAISSAVDGIIVYADESEEMKDKINLATQMGIPVVTILNDCNLSNRCSYVGIGGYNLGREYGKEVAGIVNEKKNAGANKLNVVILADSEGEDTRSSVFVSGIKDVLAGEYGDDTVVDITFAKVDNTNAFSAEESIRDIFISNEVPDILMCLNELNTTCAYQAVVDYNMVGQVDILGYYDSDIILQAIDHKVINSTISIDTYQMGQACVEALQEFHELGYTSQYIPANVQIIDSENISFYYKGGVDSE